MKSGVTAKLSFSYKGEVHDLSVDLDLDALMRESGRISSLHSRLAAAGGVDPYSYQYEVLLSEEVSFEDARGLAVDFVDGEGRFDIAGFEARWREWEVVERLRPIAQRRLGVADLDAEPALAAALEEAYRLGRDGAR